MRVWDLINLYLIAQDLFFFLFSLERCTDRMNLHEVNTAPRMHWDIETQNVSDTKPPMPEGNRVTIREQSHMQHHTLQEIALDSGFRKAPAGLASLGVFSIMFGGGDTILVGSQLMRFDKKDGSNIVIAGFENLSPFFLLTTRIM